MRIAIVSDIHGNLEALEQAVGVILDKKIDRVVCLGDIVGYGASPNECIKLIQSITPYALLGNHDEAAIHLDKAEYFNPFARIAIEWTHDELTEESKNFLRHLLVKHEEPDLLFIHSSPFEPSEWHYIITPPDAQENFDFFTQSVCFVGHSHTPEIFCEDDTTMEVVRGKKFIINVGSIGQPRDGDWRSALGIFDTDNWTYEQVRLEYDVKKAAAKIRKAGLPKALADRLLIGR